MRRKRENIKFYATSLSILFTLVILAIFVTQLETVFNLIGAIGANAISFGLPSLFYFALIAKLKDISTLPPRQKRNYYLVKIYFAFSILLMIMCVGSEVLKIA